MQPKSNSKKQKIDAEILYKLITANDSDFQELKLSLPKFRLEFNFNNVSRVGKNILFERIENIFFSEFGNITLIENIEINENIKFENLQNSITSSVVFLNSNINSIEISNSQLATTNEYNKILQNSTSFYFLNSEITKISLEKSCLRNLEFHNTNTEIINITDCTIDKIIFEGKNHNQIYFAFTSNIQLIKFNCCNTKNISVIENSKVENFTMKETTCTGLLNIENSCINSTELNSSNLFELDIIRDSNLGRVLISNKCIIENLIINGDSTIEKLLLYRSNLTLFRAECCSFELKIHETEILTIRFYYCSINYLEFGVGCKLNLFFKNGSVNYLDISETLLSNDSFFSFSDVQFFYIDINESNFLGNIIFRQANAIDVPVSFDERFEFFKFKFADSLNSQLTNEHSNYNYRKEFLIRQKERNSKYIEDEFTKNGILNPILRIVDSKLGKTEFFGCDLSKFHFIFKNSNIIDCNFIGGELPNMTDLEVFNAKDDSFEFHIQRTSLFNQIKKIFESHGDIYRATQYQAIWADEQAKVLKLRRSLDNKNKTLFHKFKNLFNENSQDIYSLYLNKWSNHHGESWIKSVILIFFPGIFFYLLTLWSLGRCFNNNNLDYNLLGYYFQFINPLHKIDFISGSDSYNGWYAVIDFLSRLFFSYVIYQFVASFRKHGKKK